MSQEFRGINDFYFVKKNKQEQEARPVDTEEETAAQEEDSPEVRLSDPQFIRPDDGYQPNKPCKMQVSVKILRDTQRKKISFDVHSSYDGNEVQEYSGLEGFIKDEKAIAEMKYFPLNNEYYQDNNKSEDAKYEVRFVASHSKGEKPAESELLEMPQEETAEDKLVFYLPSTDEYLEVTIDLIDSLEEEAALVDDLAKEIQAIWETSSFEEQSKKADEAEEKLKTVLGAKTQVSAKDTFEEMLLVKNDKNKRWGKPVSYVKRSSLKERATTGESGKAEFKRVKRSYEYEKEELKEFLGLDENSSANGPNNPLESVKANFWKKEAGGDGVWKFTARDEDGNTDTLADNENFSLSAEAQLLRFAAGVSISSDVTSILKGRPKFSIGGQAHLTFSLVEGTVEGSYYFPDKNGYNILSLFISSEKLKGLVKEGRICSILLKATLSAYAFIGANATAIIGLPNIDLTKDEKGDRKKDVKVGGDIGAGATATAGGSVSCSIDWKGHDVPAFSSLGEAKALAEGSAGIAGNLLAEISYDGKMFRVKLGVRAVVGLGGKLGSEIGLGVDEGFKFIGYIFNSFDYHYVKEILDDAFDACVRLSIAKITDVSEVIEDTANKGKELVINAFNFGERVGRNIKREMVQALSSGRKKGEIKLSWPEATGALVLGIMTRPEEEDFDAILEILRPANLHELKSILRVIGEDDTYIKTGKPERGTLLYSQWQGDALQKGIEILLSFGSDMDEQQFSRYTNKLKGVLKDAKISI